jgi:ribonucleoside-diphosphate reductase alpha chain
VNNADGKQMFLKYASPLFARACAKCDVSSESAAYKRVLTAGTCKGVTAAELGLPEEVMRVFVVSGDLSWKEHVDVQACAQRFLSNSVSKTANLHHDATTADVCKVYVYAWKQGCCGCTVYRAGSRDGEVLSAASK